MSIAVLLAVVVVATIQSLFGVGVLLFGTPLLLLLGHSFVDALLVLLPDLRLFLAASGILLIGKALLAQ